MAFNYDSMTDEQKAQFGAALGSNEEFGAAVSEQGMLSSQEVDPLQVGIQDINDRYNASVEQASQYDPTRYTSEEFLNAPRPGDEGYDPSVWAWDNDTQFAQQQRVIAESETIELLHSLGINNAEDLKTSVSGSHNDSYVNLGIANQIYDDKSRGFEPSGGSSRDVNIRDWEDTPLGASSLVEQGEKPSMFASPVFSVLAALAAPVTGGWSVAAQQAARAADGDTLHGEDYANAVASYVGNSGMLDGVVSALPESVGKVYNAPNVGGSLLRGATTTTLDQAIRDDFDLGGIAKGALVNVGMDVLKDGFLDADQTNDAHEMLNDNELVHGSQISPEDALRLEDTTDLYGMLGKNGLLSKIGLDVGYMPTDWVGEGIDFVAGFGERAFITGPDGEQYRVVENLEDVLTPPVIYNPDGTINTTIDIQDAFDGKGGFSIGTVASDGQLGPISDLANALIPDTTNRYDERFFDVTSPRSEDSILNNTGIWEGHPRGNNGRGFDLFGSALPAVNSTFNTGSNRERDESQPAPISTPEGIAVNETDTVTDEDIFVDTTAADPELSPDLTREEMMLARWEEDSDSLVSAIENDPELWGIYPEDEETELPSDEETDLPATVQDPVETERKLTLGEVPNDFEENLPPVEGEEELPSEGKAEKDKEQLADVSDAEWTALFPYTKLTPAQKKDLLPHVDYIRSQRGKV